MSDIRLAKPAANTTQSVNCTPDGRFIFEFPTNEPVFSRSGNDLVLTFEDGSVIRLQDFFVAYTKENMPTFEIDGQTVAGEDFFAALNNPDIMPAAGPAASAQGNSSFNVYDSLSLMQGIDRLGGLDIGFDGAGKDLSGN